MANDRPVILVQGILGFGPRELGRLSYWGCETGHFLAFFQQLGETRKKLPGTPRYCLV